MGSMPDWYLLLRAAKYLGVPPWELYEQPHIWLDLALAHEYAETKAENDRNRRHKK